MNYSIQFTKSAFKEAEKLPNAQWKSISEKISDLSTNPYPNGYKRIKGYSNYFRIRIGFYRVIYMIEDEMKIVSIVKIGHRKDVYRKLNV